MTHKDSSTIDAPSIAGIVPPAPTPDSVARALEAQEKERAAFVRETGVFVDRDGRQIHPSLHYGGRTPTRH